MRLPVIPNLSTKDGLANKNARMTNVLAEKNKAQIRPGLTEILNYAGVGSGLIPAYDRLLMILDDTVYDAGGAGSGGGGGGAAFNLLTATGAPAQLGYLSWNSGYTYPTGWRVTQGGATYTSTISGNIGIEPRTSSSWSPYPVAWNSGVTYLLGSQVTYGGETYTSTVSGNIGITPNTSDAWDPYTPTTHTLVAVENVPSGEGYFEVGFFGGVTGSITPTTLNEITILSFWSSTLSGPAGTVFTIDTVVSQDFFASITSNEMTLLSAAATFTQFATATSWTWENQFMFSLADTYPVTIT